MAKKSERRKITWEYRRVNNLCIYCGKSPPKLERKGCEDCLKKKVIKTKEQVKKNPEKSIQYRLLLKHQVIDKYGGKCACCGETMIHFLTIDHKNNDGKEDRMKTFGDKSPPSTTWYFQLRREPKRDDLQVLCFNCNLGKAVNGGICPHIKNNKVLHPSYDRRHDPQFDTRLKIIWPTDEELIQRCNEKSVTQIARELNVCSGSIRGRLNRRNKLHLVIKKTGGILKGEQNPSAKLKNEDVIKIRNDYQNGVPRKQLAQQFKVSSPLIDKIIANKIWTSV